MEASKYQYEDALIRLCVGQHVGVHVTPKIDDLLKKEIDWDAVLTRSMRYRVAPIIFKQLLPQYKKQIPEQIQSEFKKYCFDIAVQSLHMTRILLKILGMFKQSDIIAIPIKGPILAESAYGGAELRQFCDLDILVSKKDALKARDLLCTLGFRSDIKLNSNDEANFLEYENFFSLFSKQSGVNVDLHWELSGLYNLKPIPLEMIVEHRGNINLFGRKVEVLSDEMTLIHTCIHANSHCWDNLEYISCVAAILQREMKLDWTMLISLARALRCYRMLLIGLSLAVELFDADIPSDVEEQINKDRQLKELSAMVIAKLFEEGGGKHHALPWRFSYLHIKIRDSIFDKYGYATRLFFRPTVAELMEYSLPHKLKALYYIIRPIRLIKLGLFSLSSRIPIFGK